MEFVFENEAFQAQALRAAGFAGAGGADIGEVLATTARIPDGDEAAWRAAWRATAVRTARGGEQSLEVGDRVSAREAFLRASNYFRCAQLFHRDGPIQDAEALSLSRCARDYFFRAAELLDAPFTEVAIPYEGGDLPGYLFLVDDSGTPRPTVVYTNGFDSTREEGYFVIGAAALRRGYNFLAYDGPGQGCLIRERDVPLRPDWENVLGRVVDYALTVPEIDDGAIVQFGYGLGGQFVARYASRDHRSAAIVCNDGITTFYGAYPQIPESVLELIEDGDDAAATPLLEDMMSADTQARSRLRNGQWTFGAASAADYVRRTAEYTLTADDVRRIRTPVLVLEGEDDTVFAGQAANLARAISAPVRHVVLRNVVGAGEHCHQGAMYLLQQTVFNYLAATLPAPGGRSPRREVRSPERRPATSPSPARG